MPDSLDLPKADPSPTADDPGPPAAPPDAAPVTESAPPTANPATLAAEPTPPTAERGLTTARANELLGRIGKNEFHSAPDRTLFRIIADIAREPTDADYPHAPAGQPGLHLKKRFHENSHSILLLHRQ